MKQNLFIFLLTIISACKAQQTPPSLPTNPDNNSLLWEISGKDLKQPSYLFGTFHIMCPDDIRFSANLKEALKRSHEVYFEMDLDDAANTLGAVFFMNMKDGKKLQDLYTEDEYQRLNRYFSDSLGMPLFSFQRMKPMFLDAMLFPRLMPCKNLSGVEQELMKLAKADKKEIRGFETIKDQAAVFDSIPYELQARELLKEIDSLTYYKPMFDSMLVAYKLQQMDGLDKIMSNESFGMKDQTDILLDKRNMNWVKQMNEILPKQNIFIAVGAGHLSGPKGLIELLKKEGYSVRPIKNKD